MLALAVIEAGGPEVLTGAANLSRPVRWVHVVEAQDVTELLDGHELLLATGVAWPEGEGWIPGYIAELAAAKVAALVLELGTRYQQAPPGLVQCCKTHGIPLVVLRRRVKFVAVTEAVHGRIIAEQMGALQARDEVHALFSELSLRGAPADYIVGQLAAVLGAPVVLEDVAHQVVAFEAVGVPEEILLSGWESRSRTARRARSGDVAPADNLAPSNSPSSPRTVAHDSRTAVLGPEGWLVTPVQARGTRWGYLIVFDGAAHPAGRTQVLEQAAVALSLSRLADGTADHWTPAGQHWLLESLLRGSYRSDIALRARFEAMGLPVTGRRLCGLALRPGRTLDGSDLHVPEIAAVTKLARSMGMNAAASEVAGAGVLLVALSVPAPGPGRPEPDAAVDSFSAMLYALAAGTSATEAGPTIAAGAVVEHVGALAPSLQEALELVRSIPRNAPSTQGAPAPVPHRSADRALRGLIGALRADPRLQTYLERTLSVLLEHDCTYGTDLMPVLRSYLAHPGNRTRAAAASHLSRSVFYQRLDVIEGLLGVDLSDGETIAGLQTAVIVWETTRDRPQAR